MLAASGPVIKHCVSGKIMKVIKRQIIGFFRLVKWITQNSVFEKWFLGGERGAGPTKRRRKSIREIEGQ